MGSHAVGPLSLILDFQPSGMTAGTCITPQAPRGVLATTFSQWDQLATVFMTC